MSYQFLKTLIKSSKKQQFPLPLDGEILYSKNSVCLHLPGLLSNLHHPGFLVITAKIENHRRSLVLNWSPQTKCTGNLRVKQHEGHLCQHDTYNLNKVNDNGMKHQNSALSSPRQTNRLHLSMEKQPEGDKGKQPDHSFDKVSKPRQPCDSFAVDLGQTHSIKIFFANENHTSGQLFIGTSDSPYKFLHFHNGGLDCMADALQDWKTIYGTNINHISIIYPNLSSNQVHPEEGLYCKLTVESWSLGIDEFGRIQNELKIRKAVFFGGIENALRPVVWPYLLKFYNFKFTGEERNEKQQEKLSHYQKINEERERIFSQETIKSFWRNIACCIEKDVLRTDRANPFFKGEGNPNLDTLQRILLNYAVYTKTSYTQGMSDLLSPLLIKVQAESNVFWCFVGLMQHTIFISSPSDSEMEKQLFYLRELLRVMLPDFFHHLITCDPGAKELLFAHRWILLCFKREFCESDALSIWEACWAHYQCNYFHLFVCVAIISLYGGDVADKKLAADEMLLYFSNLALQMNGRLVLKKARGLLHHIRTSSNVPCTLHDLLYVEGSHCSSHMPVFECAKTAQCLDGCIHETQKRTLGSPRFGFRKMLAS